MKKKYIQYLSGVLSESQYYEAMESLCESFDTGNIKMQIGKHKGKTFDEIDRDDPRYLPWLSKAESKYYGHNRFYGKMINHHVNKKEIEGDLHNKVFIARVKNNFTAPNTIEKSLKVLENEPEKTIKIGYDAYGAYLTGTSMGTATHVRNEVQTKKENFSEGEIVLVCMAEILKFHQGWYCSKHQHDYDNSYGGAGHNPKEVPADKKCNSLVYKNLDDYRNNRLDKMQKCGNNLTEVGYSYRLIGVDDHMNHPIWASNRVYEFIKTNYFLIYKLSEFKGGELHPDHYVLNKEEAVRNLETLKIPGTDQKIMGYSSIQTLALANKYDAINLDDHKHESGTPNNPDFPYTFRKNEAIPYGDAIKNGIDNHKKHIVSLPYKDQNFSLMRRMANVYHLGRQIQIEKAIAFDIFCAISYGFSKINHLRRKYASEEERNQTEVTLRTTFNNKIKNMSMPEELESKLTGEAGDKLRASLDFDNLVYLCKLCVYIRENGGMDAGVRSDKVMSNAISELLRKYS